MADAALVDRGQHGLGGRQRFKGDIVRVEPRRKHGRFLYKFKVLSPEGQLVEIEMDAASGAILEVENE